MNKTLIWLVLLFFLTMACSAQQKKTDSVNLEATLFGNYPGVQIVVDLTGSNRLCAPPIETILLKSPSQAINLASAVYQGQFLVETDEGNKTMAEFGSVGRKMIQNFLIYTFRRKGPGEKTVGYRYDIGMWSLADDGGQEKIAECAYRVVVCPDGVERNLLMHKGALTNDKWTFDWGGKIMQDDGSGKLIPVGCVNWRVIAPEPGKKEPILMIKGLGKNDKWRGRYNGNLYIDPLTESNQQ